MCKKIEDMSIMVTFNEISLSWQNANLRQWKTSPDLFLPQVIQSNNISIKQTLKSLVGSCLPCIKSYLNHLALK